MACPVEARLPAVPLTMFSMSSGELITATLPVRRGKSQAAWIFGPYGAGRDIQRLQYVRLSLGGRLVEIEMGGLYVGGDDQRIGLQLLGQKRRAQVLVHHASTPLSRP
ncbi:hypothetical protein IAE35_17275 [Pseudomonas sp. S75]|uniref:hypothetical protein n=1 Tax=unclassified Pseudomonas TaxID=196821 RepID=UPI00190852FD|nr:hypothetical protein [Pseudomonas sp. S30]MBK0155095.1 hypothetical protein [Pseudomonas sp. S75]